MNRRTRASRSTLQAVADVAGVSAMTVSNVVNGSGRVGKETRERVLAAIHSLGYVPNLAARRLVGARATRLGLICPSTNGVFINSAIAAVAMEAAEAGLQLMIRRLEDPSRASAEGAAEDLVRSGADALLLIPPFAERLSGSERLARLNVAVAAMATASALPDMATVRIDNTAAARALTARLISQGHTLIGLIAGPPDHSDSLARQAGHRAALRAFGLAHDPDLVVEGAFTFETGRAAAERLLDRAPRPSAIVAANDDMAAGALWAAHQRGLSLPDDLAVAGFDDTLLATRVWPALTTIRQPVAAMAREALQLMTQELGGAPRQRDVVLEFTLVERASA
ncbi:LacI family DNA-binding transcriptional regulator [Phenylobacterium deserti]|uniref:LacI family transcriptional regulator n=1 Tax=Phenylobacterium deserti TaxID=1914756 RepID=A0A328AF79_9CAUL|nr:LacI family DNA-binding transcriptional regulator [Phenylobacterium deserti]RAK51448.1 LacI family transcriptional regulator [Phenylobacterium deserti]